MKLPETTTERIERKLDRKLRLIRVARGEEPADVVFKNATYLNVFSNDFCHGDIAVSNGLVAGIGSYHGIEEIDVSGRFVSPGFIDAHIHLESSMVSPAEFARAVVSHGTTTVITDPHEIANVMGVDGIRYMLEATESLPIDVHFMLPSCVPATPLDESGCALDYKAIDDLYDHPRVLGLAEMMNYVGVVNGDREVISKILASQAHHKKIDGHAPGLSGPDLNAYIAAGVYSDHECSNYRDALEKLQLGQFIMIREGTAAHNLRALLPLLNQQYYARCMFATDDKHPLDLLQGGHIDYIIREAIACGVDPVIAIKVASHHAARYFLMNNKGAIAPGYVADLVVFDDFRHFNIQQVYKRGRCVFAEGEVQPFTPAAVSPALSRRAHDTFRIAPVTAQQLSAEVQADLMHLPRARDEQRGDEIVAPVAADLAHGDLRAGKNDRLCQSLKHKGKRGGGIGHRVRAVEHHKAVVAVVGLHDDVVDLEPVARRRNGRQRAARSCSTHAPSCWRSRAAGPFRAYPNGASARRTGREWPPSRGGTARSAGRSRSPCASCRWSRRCR